MSPRITNHLPDSLLAFLTEGCPALLLTVGADGFAHTAYTWAVAPHTTAVHFAADYGSTTLTNLQRQQRAALQIIGQGNLVYLIKGDVHQIKTQIEAAPFNMAMMALNVREIKDQSWPNVTVKPLAYAWPPPQQTEMLAMERAVYNEMRRWST